MRHLLFRQLLLVLVLWVAGTEIAQAQQRPAANIPYPRWKILVLIYTRTDFSYTDTEGVQRRVIATASGEERLQAIAASRHFFQGDVPLLTSGMQVPELTIRYPQRAITQLNPSFCNYWLDMAGVGSDLDPNFDSVLAFWKDEGTDLLTGEAVDLTECGLNIPNGTQPTYTVIPISAVSNSRNILKHEWGHAILRYFDHAGISPKPRVNNHINDTDTRYVNCLTGQPYVLEDETLERPIPNSIYNNYSGFTHDYYSGLTATPDQPHRCLGVTSEAWASPPPTQRVRDSVEPL